ncbi:MAG TPA: ABC transporter substrate-binding protein [Candidatus Nanoarchaeia archaeon]|nr:ABC transporter substrate-binding protein [Candidatus Nanoarchaeia archaeon]
MKQLFVIALLFLLACTSTSTDKIKIGFVGALTGDGATYGADDRAGVLLALDDINAQGGINGKPLEVVFEDGKCNGKDASTALQKLLETDNVKIILGGTCSSETLAMAPITESKKVILFTAIASSPKIVDAGDFVFRNVINDNLAGKHLAELVALKNKRIAIISENTDYAQGLRGTFTKRAQELGIEIIADEVFEPGSTDFRTQLAKIKETSPDAIFIDPQSDTTSGILLKQVHELSSAQLYLAWFGGSKLVEQAGVAAENLIWNDLPQVSADNTRAQTVLQAHNAKFGTEPSFPVWMLLSYDRTRLIAEALKKCGEDTTCTRDFLYSVNFEGVAGKATFDKNGEVEGFSMQGYVRKNGQVIKYPEE